MILNKPERFFKIFFILIFFSSVSYSQTYPVNYRNFNQENGLSRNNVLQLLPLPDGRMGMVTEDAVFIHDGYTMEKWISADVLNASISYVCMQKNQVFVLTKNKGILVLDSAGRNVIKSLSLPKGINPDGMFLLGNRIYLIITKIRILIMDSETGNIIMDKPGLQGVRPNGWLLSGNRCAVANEKGLVWIGEKEIVPDNSVPFPVECLFAFRDTLFLASGEKIWKYTVGSRPFLWKTLKFPGKSGVFNVSGAKEILFIQLDKVGRIWLVPTPGDEVFVVQQNQCISLHSSNNLPLSFITDFTRDAYGNIWFSSFDQGAFAVQNTSFMNYGVVYKGKYIIPDYLYISGNSIFVSTQNGFFELDMKKGVLQWLVEPDPVFQIQTGNAIEYKNKIFVPVLSMSVLQTKSTVTFEGKKVVPVQAKKIFRLKEEWFITDIYENILRWNPDNLKTYDTLFSIPDFRIRIQHIHKTGAGYYITTNKGVYISDGKRAEPMEGTQNLNGVVLFEENNKLYLVHQSGVVRITNKALLPLLSMDGIYHARMQGSKFLLGGSFGLLEADSLGRIGKSYQRTYGFLSKTIRHFILSDSNLWVAGYGGIQTIKYNDLNNTNKSLIVKRILLNNSIIPLNDMIWLGKNDALRVEYIYPEFFFPENVEFFYKLDDGNYQKLNSPAVTLSNLKGGITHLCVKANDSLPVCIRIRKEKKFSETLGFWFCLAGGVLILSGTSTWFLYHRLRLRARRRMDAERTMHLLKHQAMNALLSPHFIFNSLTSIQHYINTNNSLKASEFLAKFSRLIRMIIERAADAEIPLNVELERLKYYLELEKERFGGKFDYELKVDEELRQMDPFIPNMIVQPFAENAILHGLLPKGEGGKLKIFFQLKNPTLEIIIEDNGVGLSAGHQGPKHGHKSLATSTIRNILKLNSRLKKKKQQVIMEELKDNNGNPAGTKVTIQIEI